MSRRGDRVGESVLLEEKKKNLEGCRDAFRAFESLFLRWFIICHRANDGAFRRSARVPSVSFAAPLAFLRCHSIALPLSALSASRTSAVARASAPALRAMASSSHGDPYTFPGFLKLHRQLVGHCFSGCFAR